MHSFALPMLQKSDPRPAAALLWGASLFALAGCSHPGSLPSFSGSERASGASSVVFVDSAKGDGPAGKEPVTITKSMTGFVKPEPIEPLALPTYPARALAAHCGAVRLAVRIDISSDGHVTSVGPSAHEFSTPTPFDTEFQHAIEAAVLTWKFQPGWTVPMEPGPDGKPILGEPVASESSLEAIFTFTSAGTVTTGIRP